MYMTNGLRKKPTYDELIQEIGDKQDKIKYPDRFATQLRNSPYLSQFDGDGALDLQDQENAILKQQMMENEIRRVAATTGQTAQVLRSMSTQTGITNIASGTQTHGPTNSTNATQTHGATMKNTGSQAWKANVSSSGVQTEALPTTG